MVAVECPTWPVSYAECDTFGPEACWTPTAKATWERIAAEYLWNWTGRGYGLCPVAVRPCRSDCYRYPGASAGGAWSPVLIGGRVYNIGCWVCGDDCSCDGVTAALRLPGPIDSVTGITIDGVLLDDEAYRVDNGSVLVRLDGSGWPTCQDMSSPATEAGTWVVDYVRGVPVPAGGQIAAGVLAVELAKAACGDASCQLPRRVQTITRQGVTVALLDAFDDVGKGRTGVWLIDSWVASVTGAPRGGSVRSVDVPHPRHRVTTWTAPVVLPPV